MTNLLDLVLEAHGGLRRWQEAGTIHAKGSVGGLLWTLRGQEGILATVDMAVDVQQQRVVFKGFTDPELRGVFTPGRVAIERRDGEVVAERTSPREAFAGHGPDTPWDQLHVLYFAGYAMWNYLTAPYLLTRPGVAVEELEPWEETGENGRRLRATFLTLSRHTPGNRLSTTTPPGCCAVMTTQPTYSAARPLRICARSTQRYRDWSSQLTGTSCPFRRMRGSCPSRSSSPSISATSLLPDHAA